MAGEAFVEDSKRAKDSERPMHDAVKENRGLEQKLQDARHAKVIDDLLNFTKEWDPFKKEMHVAGSKAGRTEPFNTGH